MTGHSASIARFAIYARYSSPLQEMTSIAGQLRLCRDRVADLGGVIAGEYTDPEVTGTSMQLRPGLRQLLDDARAHRFDSICIEALDRLARSQADMAWLYRELQFLGIRLHSLEDGQVDALHAGIKGIVSEMFIDNIGNKTRRGQIEAMHDHRVIGARIYGYRIANRIDENGKPIRGLRVIEPCEAEVVRRIYQLYLDGMSPQQIIVLLDQEDVPGPFGRPWTAASVRGREGSGILRNDIYRGRIVYGRTRGRRHPGTGRRHFEPRPSKEWTVIEAPELRIVDDATWQAAQDEVKRRRSRHNAVVTRYRKAAYPLTARVRCGLCGSPMTIAGMGYYRCVTRQRQPDDCGNNRGIPLEILENLAVRELFRWMLAPGRDWQRMFAAAELENTARRQALRDRADEVNAGIAHLVAAIESGLPSTSIHDRVLELERARKEILAELEQVPERPPPAAFSVEDFVRDYLARFRGAVTGNTRTARREEVLLTVRNLIARIDVRPSRGRERNEVETVPDIPAILDLIARHAAAGPAASGA